MVTENFFPCFDANDQPYKQHRWKIKGHLQTCQRCGLKTTDEAWQSLYSRRKYRKAHPMRFPRIRLTGEIRHFASVLRITYNKMAWDRHTGKRLGRWDILETKWGATAAKNFLILAKHLVARRIDPALYVKVMCQFGKWAESLRMPPTSWLRNLDTILKFQWVVRREREKYERAEDWEKAISGNVWNEEHITTQIENSAQIVTPWLLHQRLTLYQATVLQLPLVSPWFLAVNQPFIKQKGLDLLDSVDRAVTLDCRSYLRTHPATRHAAYVAFKKFANS